MTGFMAFRSTQAYDDFAEKNFPGYTKLRVWRCWACDMVHGKSASARKNK